MVNKTTTYKGRLETKTPYCTSLYYVSSQPLPTAKQIFSNKKPATIILSRIFSPIHAVTSLLLTTSIPDYDSSAFLKGRKEQG